MQRGHSQELDELKTHELNGQQEISDANVEIALRVSAGCNTLFDK